VGKSSGYSSAARRQAAHILSQPPFKSKPGSAPLRGFFNAIGRGLEKVFGPIFRWLGRDLFRPIGHFGVDLLGPYWWIALAGIAVIAGVFIGRLLIGRRARIGRNEESELADDPAGVEDVASLEAAAAAAEASGQLEEAVRLRFRAGLARLESLGIISNRLATTSHQARRILHNRSFDAIADRHEEIAYASARAAPADAAAAREGWPRVIAEASKATAEASQQ
jgi:hypothetical protein